MKLLEKIKVALLVLLMMGAFIACSDDDTPAPAPVVPDVEVEEPETNEPTAEELAEMAAADKFAAANSVYRALALLDELPQNWESATFQPEVGFAQDEANPDVRNVIAEGADDAEAYFLSIVPDLGVDGNTWSHEGVGTLTLRMLNEKDCFAIIDVNLVQMPGLKQLRFIPEELAGDNKYYGEPYYHVGDVYMDMKTGHEWICVRPAGGPLHKDYAYFISFGEFTDDITDKDEYYVTSQVIYDTDEKGKLTKKRIVEKEDSKKWIYVQNMLEERIAIAAAHTFAMFNGAINNRSNPLYKDFAVKANFLKQQRMYDFNKYIKNLEEGIDVGKNAYAFAYGSKVSNKYTKVRQEKYLQPFLILSHEGASKDGTKIKEHLQKTWPDPEKDEPSPYLLSVTTDYDPLSFCYLNKVPKSSWDSGAMGKRLDYDGRIFLEHHGGEHHSYNKKHERVLFARQRRVVDNGEPDPEFQYIAPSHLKVNPNDEPDYWKSLNSVERYLYEYRKNWTLVKNIKE